MAFKSKSVLLDLHVYMRIEVEWAGAGTAQPGQARSGE